MENNQEIAFNIFLKNFKKNVSKIGLKNSIQKDYILKVLYFSKKHLTAEEISNEIKESYAHGSSRCSNWQCKYGDCSCG